MAIYAQSYHVNETIHLRFADAFYGAYLEHCLLIMEPEASPTFLGCSLVRCKFDPPLVIDDMKSWRCLRVGENLIENPQ
jgi:hypothetical protein